MSVHGYRTVGKVEATDPEGWSYVEGCVCWPCLREYYWRKERGRAKRKKTVSTLSIPYEDDLIAQGLADMGPMTLEEIGAVFGVTRERIRQIGADGLKKLGARFPELAEALVLRGEMALDPSLAFDPSGGDGD